MTAKRTIGGIYQFRWWLWIAVAMVLATVPLLEVGPYPLPLLGAAIVIGAFLSAKGSLQRQPLMVLGVTWTVIGLALLPGYATHTGSNGTHPIRVTRVGTLGSVKH